MLHGERLIFAFKHSNLFRAEIFSSHLNLTSICHPLTVQGLIKLNILVKFNRSGCFCSCLNEDALWGISFMQLTLVFYDWVAGVIPMQTLTLPLKYFWGCFKDLLMLLLRLYLPEYNRMKCNHITVESNSVKTRLCWRCKTIFSVLFCFCFLFKWVPQSIVFPVKVNFTLDGI